MSLKPYPPKHTHAFLWTILVLAIFSLLTVAFRN